MRRTRTIIGISLVVSFAVGGPAAGAAGSGPSFDGKDLFTGLFLAQGPVARAYPALKVPHAGGWDAKAAGELAGRMAVLRPEFFAGFKIDMTSGDRVRIERAAEAAVKLATSAAAPALDPGGGHVPGGFIVVDKTIIKAQNVIVNKNKYWGVQNDASAGLARERWVNKVAETLSR